MTPKDIRTFKCDFCGRLLPMTEKAILNATAYKDICFGCQQKIDRIGAGERNVPTIEEMFERN